MTEPPLKRLHVDTPLFSLPADVIAIIVRNIPDKLNLMCTCKSLLQLILSRVCHPASSGLKGLKHAAINSHMEYYARWTAGPCKEEWDREVFFHLHQEGKTTSRPIYQQLLLRAPDDIFADIGPPIAPLVEIFYADPRAIPYEFSHGCHNWCVCNSDDCLSYQYARVLDAHQSLDDYSNILQCGIAHDDVGMVQRATFILGPDSVNDTLQLILSAFLLPDKRG